MEIGKPLSPFKENTRGSLKNIIVTFQLQLLLTKIKCVFWKCLKYLKQKSYWKFLHFIGWNFCYWSGLRIAHGVMKLWVSDYRMDFFLFEQGLISFSKYDSVSHVCTYSLVYERIFADRGLCSLISVLERKRAVLYRVQRIPRRHTRCVPREFNDVIFWIMDIKQTAINFCRQENFTKIGGLGAGKLKDFAIDKNR